MNRPTIAHVTGVYPPTIGGVELRVKKLAEMLVKKGYPVVVLTSSNGLKPQTVIEKDEPVVHYLRSFTFANTPIAFTLLYKLIRLPKNSIIHLHAFQTYNPEIVFLASKIKKIPYVMHIRMDIRHEGPFGFVIPAYNKLILGPILRRANKIICLTDDYADLMVNKYKVKSGKVVVIPNATDFKVAPEPKKKLHRPIRIVFVGRLATQKNIPMLLDALALYKKMYDANFHLDIVGSGELRAMLEAQIRKLKLSREVTLHGTLLNAKLEKAYERSDLFVSPTLFESFGTVYIEAMAKGLPIITSNVNAVRNVVRNRQNGLLTEISIEGICNAFHDLITDEDLYMQISKNNLIDVQRYKWDEILKKTTKVYQNI